MEEERIELDPELCQVFSEVLAQSSIARAAVIGFIKGRRGEHPSYRLVVSAVHLEKADTA